MLLLVRAIFIRYLSHGYGAQVDYTCGSNGLRQFDDGSGGTMSIYSAQCQWDGQWSQDLANIPGCTCKKTFSSNNIQCGDMPPEGVACEPPPTPEASTNLEFVNTLSGTEYAIDTVIQVKCKDDTFFVSNYYKAEDYLICRNGNVWDVPTDTCIIGNAKKNLRSYHIIACSGMVNLGLI